MDKLFAEVLAGGFAGFPLGFDGIHQFRVLGAANGAQSGKGNVGILRRFFPADSSRPREIPEAFGSGLQTFAVLIGNVFVLGQIDRCQQFFHGIGPIVAVSGGGFQQFPAPKGFSRIGDVLGKQQIPLSGGPCGGVGMALHTGVQRQNQALQPGVVPPGAYGIRQQPERGVLVNGFIPLFQYLGQAGLFQLVHAVLLRNFEIRAQPQTQTMLPNQIGAESVNGADLGVTHQRILTAERRITRVPGHLLGDFIQNSAPQFPCGGSGIGDNQKGINAFRGRFCEISHQPFGQHLGFAGTGGCGHQNAPATRLNGMGLINCRGKFSHGSLLLVSKTRLL